MEQQPPPPFPPRDQHQNVAPSPTAVSEIGFRKQVLASITRLAATLGISDQLPDFNELSQRIRGASQDEISAEIADFVARASEAMESAATVAQVETNNRIEALEGEKEDLAQSLEAARHQASTLEDEVRQLETGSNQVVELARRCEELEAKLGEERQGLADLSANNEAELAQLRARLEDIQASAESSLEASDAKDAELAELRAKLEDAMNQLDTRRADDDQRTLGLEEEVKSAKAAAEQAFHAAESKDGELADLKQSLAELAQKLDAANELAEQRLREAEDLKTELAAAAVQQAISAPLEPIAAPVSDFADSAALDNLREEADSARKEVERIRGELEEARWAADQARTEAEQARADLAQAQADAEAARGDLELAKDDAEMAQSQLRDFQAVYNSLQDAQSAKDRDLEELRAAALAKEAELEELRSTASATAAKLSDHETLLAAAQERVAELETELSSAAQAAAKPQSPIVEQQPSSEPTPTETLERGTMMTPPAAETVDAGMADEATARISDLESSLREANERLLDLEARLAEKETAAVVQETSPMTMQELPTLGVAPVTAVEALTDHDASKDVENKVLSGQRRISKGWSEKMRVLQTALSEAQEAAKRQEDQIRQLGLINSVGDKANSKSLPSSPVKNKPSDLARQQSKRLGQLLAENASLKKSKALLELQKDEEIRGLKEQLSQRQTDVVLDSSLSSKSLTPVEVEVAKIVPDPALLRQLAEKDALISQFKADIERAQGLAKTLSADSEQHIAELRRQLDDVTRQLEQQTRDKAEMSATLANVKSTERSAELQLELEALRAQMDNLAVEKQTLERDLDEAVQAKDVALEARTELARQLAESEKMRTDLERSLEQLRIELEAAKSVAWERADSGDETQNQVVAKVEAELREAKAIAEAAVAQREELSRVLDSTKDELQGQVQQLSDRVSALESELQEAREAAASSAGARDEALGRLQHVEDARKQAEDTVNNLRSQIQVGESLEEDLRAPLRDMEAKESDLRSQVEAAMVRVQDLESQEQPSPLIDDQALRAEREEAQRREAELRTALEQAEDSRRQAENELLQRTAAFQDERRQLLDKLDATEAKFVELNLEREGILSLLDKERQNATELAKAVADAHARLEAETRRIGEVQALLDRAQQQRVFAEQEYERLAASFRNVEHELHISEARSPALSGATLNESAWDELGGLVRENVSRGWKALDELQTVFDTFGIDRSKLAKDIAAAGESLDSALQRSLDQASAEMQHLRNQLIRATYLAETATNRVTELEREVADPRHIRALEAAVSDLRFEKEALDSQLANVQAQNRSLREEIGQLQHQLRAMGQTSSQAEESRKEVAFFRQNLDEANRRISELRDERDEFKRRLQDTQAGRRTDADQIVALLEDLRDLTERLADAKIERQSDRQKFDVARLELERRLRDQAIELERYEKQVAEIRGRLLQESEEHDRELLRVVGETRVVEDRYRALTQVQTEASILRDENTSLLSQLETEKADALALEESVGHLSSENLQLKASSLALEQAKAALSEQLFELNRSHKELVASFERTRLQGEQLASLNAQLNNDLQTSRDSLGRCEKELLDLRQVVTKLQATQTNPAAVREAFFTGQKAAETENDRLREEVNRLHDELDRAVRDRESVRRDRDSVLSRLKKEMNEIDGVLRKREDTIKSFVELRKKFADSPRPPERTITRKPDDTARFETRSLNSLRLY